MGEVIYTRSFYNLNEEEAKSIASRAKAQNELLMDKDENMPPGTPWPLPDVALGSTFLMVLMQGYLSSPWIPDEMKSGIADLYEKIVDSAIEDIDERIALKVKAAKLIASSSSVRDIIISYKK